MRARAEPFGAWAQLDDGTLVALSRRGASRLGVDGGHMWEGEAPPWQEAPVSAPLEVHVAVTSRCPVACSGCYLDARPDGAGPAFEVLEARLEAIARAGVFTVAFGGGEPLTRADLGALGARARELGLVPVVTTSGIGITKERAAELVHFAQINVSYDGAGADYERVRGFDGAAMAERAMGVLRDAGIPFGVNVVLTRRTFSSLPDTLRAAEAQGAREAQLLRYKPAGRADAASYREMRLTSSQIDDLYPMLERLASELRLSLRIDCALVPFLGGHVSSAETLARFGVFGCEAGRHLAAVRVDGSASPCSFAPPSGLDAAGLAGELRSDAAMAAWRSLPSQEPCASCPIRASCRGGCKVVSSHLTGAFGPDPECPRVRAHRDAND
jgi:radical SAM protein with 4Fe4S-binding SPASM domain